MAIGSHSVRHRSVGHKGVYARLRRARGAGTALQRSEGLAYAVPTSDGAACIDADGGHGVRQSLIRIGDFTRARSPSKTGVNALVAHPTSATPA